MIDLLYKFEELPLVLAPGIEGALIDGFAEIEYTREGEWSLRGVYVEAHKRLSIRERAEGMKPWVVIPASAALSDIITGRLNGEWRDRVQSAVNNALEEERESA